SFPPWQAVPDRRGTWFSGGLADASEVPLARFDLRQRCQSIRRPTVVQHIRRICPTGRAEKSRGFQASLIPIIVTVCGDSRHPTCQLTPGFFPLSYTRFDKLCRVRHGNFSYISTLLGTYQRSGLICL